MFINENTLERDVHSQAYVSGLRYAKTVMTLINRRSRRGTVVDLSAGSQSHKKQHRKIKTLTIHWCSILSRTC